MSRRDRATVRLKPDTTSEPRDHATVRLKPDTTDEPRDRATVRLKPDTRTGTSRHGRSVRPSRT